MKRTFRDSVCLVIGGSSGIGRAVGLALAREGATVVFGGRSVDALREVTAEATALGARAAWQRVDVRDAAHVQSAVDFTVAELGRLDVMFNGAGAAMVACADEASLDQVDALLDVNLRGTMHGVRAAYPLMKAQRSGIIINVSSLAGLVPAPGFTAYCASKYAVVGLSESLRLEAAEHGVQVNVVCPAAVKTPIFHRATFVNVDGPKWIESLPPGGISSPEECARDILAGVRRGGGILTPGGARTVARIARWLPGVWNLASKKMSANLRNARSSPRSSSG